MILIETWIEGTMALLQHRMADGALDRGKTRTNVADAANDPRNEAEAGVYRLKGPGSQCAIPGAGLARLLREAGGAHKIKGSRKSVKYLVPAAVQFCHLHGQVGHDFQVQPAAAPGDQICTELDYDAFVLHGDQIISQHRIWLSFNAQPDSCTMIKLVFLKQSAQCKHIKAPGNYTSLFNPAPVPLLT